MRQFEIRYLPEALADLDSIETFVAAEAGREIAETFVDRSREACEALAFVPRRGSIFRRGPPEIRTLGVRRQATIAFAIDAEVYTVTILGIFYRGRNVTAALSQRL